MSCYWRGVGSRWPIDPTFTTDVAFSQISELDISQMKTFLVSSSAAFLFQKYYFLSAINKQRTSITQKNNNKETSMHNAVSNVKVGSCLCCGELQ